MTLKLKSYYENLDEFNQVCSVTNVDDIFRRLREEKIEEVIVSIREMLIIVIFVLANFSNQDFLKMINTDQTKWTALKVIREGKIDKFLGVKLILEE